MDEAHSARVFAADTVKSRARANRREAPAVNVGG